MGFDKTELKEHKKQVVRACKELLTKIELLDEQFEDYTQYLSDEEKDDQLEVWEEKQDQLFDLQSAIEDWIEESKKIR